MKVDMKDVQEDFKRYQAEIDALKGSLSSAVDRIKDLLMQDDGQAWVEAEKYVKSMDKLLGRGE